MAQQSSVTREASADYLEEKLRTFEFYHGNLPRHNAEALLIANGVLGSFLLRSTEPRNYAVSVRTTSNVVHYAVKLNAAGEVTFGLKQFVNMEEFIAHLQGCPMVGSTDGTVVFLSMPYPSRVEEPDTYIRLNIHFEGGTFAPHPRKGGTSVPSLAGRTGYMVKQGMRVKSWKQRWFVLEQNDLKYYNTKEDKKPIDTLNLSKCSKVEKDVSQNQQNCFSLTFPERTYYMYTSTPEERRQWMDLIQFKLTKATKHNCE